MSEHRDLPIGTHEGMPELYLRVNVAQNTKGYTADKTASARGACSVAEIERLVRELLSAGDAVARDEIAACKRLDGGQ